VAQNGRRPAWLDPHEAFILGLIEQSRDFALAEIAERLADAHGISACPSTAGSPKSSRCAT
jgi:transposase